MDYMKMLLDIIAQVLQLGNSPAGQQAAMNVLTQTKTDLDKALAAQKDAPEPKG